MTISQQLVDSGDFFDRLPDEIVLSIFDKLGDAKSLCLSMSVCRRFRSIAPQVDRIFVPVPQKKSAVKEIDRGIQRNSLKNFVIRALTKPFHIVSQMIKSKSKNEENDLDFYSHYIPNQILKPFEEIRALHVRLPCHGNQKQGSKTDKNSTTFLKWKALFGRELHNCVILGAKSWTEKGGNTTGPGQDSRVMSDEELKLRIVWTISCLIAASARHYLIQETVNGLKTVENVVVTDESDQGKLCLNKEQIEETRESKGKGEEAAERRSRVPAMTMKMWYLERLALPDSGRAMEGATLVVVRPLAGGGGGAEEVKERVSDAEMVAEAFGEEGNAVGEAVKRLMVGKKYYLLEMNSF